MGKILFVITASDHWTLADGTKHPAGFWAEEAIGPYEVFKAAGYEIAAVTPGGVPPTVDALSLTPEFNGGPEGAERMKTALREATELAHPVRSRTSTRTSTTRSSTPAAGDRWRTCPPTQPPASC